MAIGEEEIQIHRQIALPECMEAASSVRCVFEERRAIANFVHKDLHNRI